MMSVLISRSITGNRTFSFLKFYFTQKLTTIAKKIKGKRQFTYTYIFLSHPLPIPHCPPFSLLSLFAPTQDLFSTAHSQSLLKQKHPYKNPNTFHSSFKNPFPPQSYLIRWK